MKFIIEQGYISGSNGWVASDTGSLYAIVKINENNNQIGEAEVVLDLEDIPKVIRRIMEGNYHANYI